MKLNEPTPHTGRTPGHGPARVELAIGHSMGRRLLAMAIDAGRLRPDRAVFGDPAWSAGNAGTAREFLARKDLTAQQMRQGHPTWPEETRRAKLRAPARWDVATIQLIPRQADYQPAPAMPPALVVLADPSLVVTPQVAVALRVCGHTITGAGHVIHNDDFDGSMAVEDRL